MDTQVGIWRCLTIYSCGHSLFNHHEPLARQEPHRHHQQLVPAKKGAQTLFAIYSHRLPCLEIFEVVLFFCLHLQSLPRVALQQDGREGVALDLRHGILDAASAEDR